MVEEKAKRGERGEHKCSEQMERRRQTDENRSCSVGSVEWLGDRGEQDDRGRDGVEGEEKGQAKNMVRGVGRKESKNKAVAEKQEFMGSVA